MSENTTQEMPEAMERLRVAYAALFRVGSHEFADMLADALKDASDKDKQEHANFLEEIQDWIVEVRELCSDVLPEPEDFMVRLQRATTGGARREGVLMDEPVEAL